jgi:(p)ppGpp synthase/HD superfamily hydrolase
MADIFDKKELQLRAAQSFAEVAHEGQKYGDEPYTVHLKAVAMVLCRFGCTDEHLLSAAFLHDVVEDTDVTIDQVNLCFGKRVADLVYRVTNEPGANRMARHVATYPKIKESEDAVMLKLADRIANVEASVEDPDKMKMYTKEWPFFKESLYTPGLHEPMWKHLVKLMEKT